MSAKQAWEKICAQIRRGSRRTGMIVLALALIVLGAFTLFIYVGIGLAAAGAVLLIVTVRKSKAGNVDVDSLYEKYILTEWFAEVFDGAVFDRGARFKDKEFRALGMFESDWNDTVCNRCFTATYNGHALRAAEVVLSGSPGEGTRIGWNYEEPVCYFWGRVWEIGVECSDGEAADMGRRLEAAVAGMPGRFRLHYADGRLYLLHNLYSSVGAYPWWLPAPNKDSMDYGKLESEAKESAQGYKRVLDEVMQ